MNLIQSDNACLVRLDQAVRRLYVEKADLVPYHGWHHVHFVVQKADLFLTEIGADRETTLAAAYVHDFNYLVPAEGVEPAGGPLRRQVLGAAGYGTDFIDRIEQIVFEAGTVRRDDSISPEAMALSDGDTAYKALPIAPLMSAHYLRETGDDLYGLAKKIVSEQVPLEQRGIYFYSQAARSQFGTWADANLALWWRVRESFDSDDVRSVVRDMTETHAHARRG